MNPELSSATPSPDLAASGERWARQFGQVVRQERDARRWSQEALALRADLNRSYLGEIERGDCMPSLASMAKIAGAFGERLSSLLARCEAEGTADAAAIEVRQAA